jgi:hypothetical protein
MVQKFLFLNRNQARSFIVPAGILLLIIVIVSGSILLLSGWQGNSNTSKNTTNGDKANPLLPGSVSPFIFGSNLQLATESNQVVTSLRTRYLLQIIHTRIIRMPLSSEVSDTTLREAAQAVQAIGATPLVVLRAMTDTNALADDTQAISIMNALFGQQTVYYEYGNELDALGITAQQYATSWNAIIPHLKQIAPHGRFVGPVNAQYDSAYLTTFLQNAHPLPDDISWHEYTCDRSWSDQLCITHIADWTTHITDARKNMQANIHIELPIMITEWNYAANALNNDGKSDNAAFMTTWTTKAFQTLAANHILASMQYTSTNSATPLVGTDETLTAQGMVFQQEYEQMIPETQTPIAITTSQPITSTATTLASPTPTPTPTSSAGTSTSASSQAPTPQPTASQPAAPQPPATTPPQSAQGPVVNFSFEDRGVDGWEEDNGSYLYTSTAVAHSGQRSLALALKDTSANDYPIVYINTWDAHAQMPSSGQTISAYVYIDSGSVAIQGNVFVEDTHSQQHFVPYDNLGTLTSGAWNYLSYTVPDGISVEEYGIGLHSEGSISNATIYFDDISWG